MMITKERVLAAIERAPAIRPVLARLAKRAAAGKKLPETFSAPGLDYAAQRELEGLFGTIGQRTADGRVYISVMPPLREPCEWRGLIDALGVAGKGNGNDDEDVFARLKLLEPDFSGMLDSLAQNDEVGRFVSKPANRKPWMALFRGAVGIVTGRTDHTLKTLSQLGSDWLGDSKSLRTGALRRQLVLICSALGDTEQDNLDERRTLENFMIIDNPYTSNVTVFAPIVLNMESGLVLDYPARLFENGLAATMPLETVGLIKSIEWKGDIRDMVTCENAAPFTGLVGSGQPSVYTAGYPSLAVKMLLFLLSELGLRCVHSGDADLDGFRIAEEVGNYIKVKSVAAAEVLRHVKGDDGIALTQEQSRRAWAYLAKHPEFRFADDVRRMLARGRWIEQESFGSILGDGGKRK